MIALERHGEGFPLVLVHGLAASREIWRHVLPLLDGELLTLDVPGFGASAPVGAGFDLAAVTDAIAAVLPPRFDLAGHSMGGALALTLAARHPLRVRRLVLCAPAGLRAFAPLVGAVAGAFTQPLVALRRAGAPLSDFPWGRRVLLGVGVADGAALAPAEVRMLVGASRGASRIGAALAAVATADLRATLRDLPLPVGAVWGERDRVIPSAGRTIFQECRPRAPLEIVAGAGHIPMVERPQAFADALSRALVHAS